jgi:outer membrane protein assembly factor BamD (BamD/ComL family)
LLSLEAGISRKDQRRHKELIDYNVDNLDDLQQQAHLLASEGDFEGAIHRYNVIGRSIKNSDKEAEWLATLAGYEYEAGHPARALDFLSRFGKKFPDSPHITKLIDLAYRIGQGYTLQNKEEFEAVFEKSKAIKAFEFVNTHDPYSLRAAESQLSIACIKMGQNYWDEALVQLKDILRKQPGSDIAARTEVIIGECYLGFNKGSDYDSKLLVQAERYLSGYLKNYPNGINREKAQKLLDNVRLRVGRAQLDVARYYCTARKWQAAKGILVEIANDEQLSPCHPEAKALISYVEARL